MAHIATRVAEVEQTPLLTVMSLLFLIVFSLKSAYFFTNGYLVHIVHLQLPSLHYSEHY